jgi:hypothetical protein
MPGFRRFHSKRINCSAVQKAATGAGGAEIEGIDARGGMAIVKVGAVAGGRANAREEQLLDKKQQWYGACIRGTKNNTLNPSSRLKNKRYVLSGRYTPSAFPKFTVFSLLCM